MGCMSLPRRHARLRNCLVATVVATCALSLVTAPAAVAGSACQSASATPAQTGTRAIVQATLCTINAERRSHGLRPLGLNARLSKAAAAHAADMDARNYFSHDSLGGGSFVDRIRRAGYLNGARSWTVGENLAWGARGRSTPLHITRMWMNSPGHRANILSGSFREIGIGISHGAPVAGRAPAATYATDFGARS
jgi:uncharacterized protein YkwD